MLNVLTISEMTATRAAIIGLRTNNDFIAGSKAVLIQSLKEKMANGIAHFLFIKKSGEVREAWGTLNKSLVAKYINGRGVSREVFFTTAYFDVEKGAWRSFRWESIISIL
ncbi:SH3 beta-barrel fold-containing protein [Paludibacter jiangxiensis]|uniref:Uncharacterized protein n=1 Tax=Paludibacter jiangxiensis TaxID=681398 RepID=A0A171A8H8_9BACT|nr:SH3 beta-barrel fold-containing protein [Paludibacter jiangxiensis]GAT63391.1 hypothetical protein PJIAN_3720 [Paludibacter jiangxiensis]